MNNRQATPEEIIAQFERAIRTNDKVSYRGFVQERSNRRARSGVSHVQYFRAKIFVKDGKPMIRVKDREDELTATMYMGEGAQPNGTLFDLRIKSEYLK